MNKPEWTKEFSASINICDREGILIYLNDKAIRSLEKEGGEKLIGTNLIDCHPEGESRNKFVEMLNNGTVNCYIIERENKKKFVYQAPWFTEGEFKGLAEIIIEIPRELIIHKKD